MKLLYTYFKTLFFGIATLFIFQCDGTNTHLESSGTLIVTYQTGIRGERLDRIRFLVKDMRHQQQMYPKGSAFVDDDYCISRMVVIEDLPKGEYTLEFVIPNHDRLFEEVPIRKFVITQDEVVKIDQCIPVRYATIQAVVQSNTESLLEPLPTVTLSSNSSYFTPQSGQGKLTASCLIPGTYTLAFEDVPDYITPLPVEVKVASGENVGPIVGIYKRKD